MGTVFNFVSSAFQTRGVRKVKDAKTNEMDMQPSSSQLTFKCYCKRTSCIYVSFRVSEVLHNVLNFICSRNTIEVTTLAIGVDYRGQAGIVSADWSVP